MKEKCEERKRGERKENSLRVDKKIINYEEKRSHKNEKNWMKLDRIGSPLKVTKRLSRDFFCVCVALLLLLGVLFFICFLFELSSVVALGQCLPSARCSRGVALSSLLGGTLLSEVRWRLEWIVITGIIYSEISFIFNFPRLQTTFSLNIFLSLSPLFRSFSFFFSILLSFSYVFVFLSFLTSFHALFFLI